MDKEGLCTVSSQWAPGGEERFVKHKNIQTAVYIVHSDSKKTSLHAFSESKTVTWLLDPGPVTRAHPFLLKPRGLYFSKALFEGLMYGRKCEIQNRLAHSWKEIYRFCFVLLCKIEGNFQVQAPRGLYLERRFNGRFFALRVWGCSIWSALYMEALIFGILRYLTLSQSG